MTKGEVEALIRGLAPALRDLVDRRINERLRALGLDTTSPSSSAAPGVTFHEVSPDQLSGGKPKLFHRGDCYADRWFSRGDGVLHKSVPYRCLSGNRDVEPGSPGSESEWARLT